jgi:hypothetical protein
MFSPLRTLFRLDEKYLECSFIYFNVGKDYLLEKKEQKYTCSNVVIFM